MISWNDRGAETVSDMGLPSVEYACLTYGPPPEWSIAREAAFCGYSTISFAAESCLFCAPGKVWHQDQTRGDGRMVKRMVLAWVMLLASVVSASAQDAPVWIQIEAQPNLNTATERARDYAADLPDVNGFSLGGGWYGIALGPYARSDAEQVLRVYRSEGVIPRDSYIALSSAFRQQF